MRSIPVLFVIGCAGAPTPVDSESSGETDSAPPDDSAVDSAFTDSGDSGDPGGDSGDSSDSGSDTGGGDTDGGPIDCAAIPTFEDGRSPNRWIHVATTGNDNTGDGSEGAPYRTIAHAAGQATPGTAVVLHSGTWTGGTYIDDLQGTAESPIWIGGAPDEARPVIQGSAEGLHLTRARYLIVHDVELRNSTDNGVNADDGGAYSDQTASHHVIFRDLYVHDIGSGGNEDCLKLSGLNDYFVLDSEFTVCGGGGYGSAIDHVGCHRGVIAGNSFHALDGTGVQAKGGSEDIELRANRFEHAGDRAVNLGGSTDFEYFRPPLSTSSANAEARDIRVVANLFVGSEAPIAYVGCVDCAVTNNTIVDPESFVLRILQETTSGGGYSFEPTSNGVFKNNLVTWSSSDVSYHVNVGSGTAPETFTFQNNLWYAHDAPAQSTPDLPVTQTGAIIGQNPGLQGDYSILSSSPAAGAGASDNGLFGDLAGTCYADPPSIGAFERP